MQYSIVREIDEVGRIVLPKEFTNALAWSKGEKIAITKMGGRLILEADPGSCFICGKHENLFSVQDRFICGNCLSEIKNGIKD